jgi:uncharacterized protein
MNPSLAVPKCNSCRGTAMPVRSAGLAPLLLFLLAGACGQTSDPAGDCTLPTLSADPAPASALAAFAYDRAAAYDPKLQLIGTETGVKIHALSFLSPRGSDLATGLLFVPEGAGPFAGLLLMHGMPGNAAAMKGIAVELARHGAVVVALDAPFARRGGNPLRFTEADSAEQVQLMTELQRAVDLLVARSDVDASRLGYMGVSYGGAMGALFVGIEHRLKTGILVVADGGLVSHYTGPDDVGTLFAGLTCAQQRRWLESMIPVEPIKYVGFASPTPLLLQSGRQDALVPMPDAERLHAAVRDPKTILWYDAGHNLTTEAAHDRLSWLQQRLGMLAP